MIYGNFSFFNSLLIDYQCPNFFELSTQKDYSNKGINISKNAKEINILVPTNKNLDLVTLFDCKDTDIKPENFKTYDLPALFYSNYNEIYTAFVKAIYTNGYKIKYIDNLDSNFLYDKNNKTIIIKNGLSNSIKIKYLLDIYSEDITKNDFEKKLVNHIINKNIGIDDDFIDKYSLKDWYDNSNFEDVENIFKVICFKCRRFINNFNKFYKKEFSFDTKKELYDKIDFSI